MRAGACAWVLGAGLCAVAGSAFPATRVRVRKGPEYPLYCAGIVVGMSTDRDVRRMYGDGYFVRNEGHGGGRYFVDPRHRVTLHVVTGVDAVIEELTYSRGANLPRRAGRRALADALASRLTAHEWFGQGLRLGERAGYVVQQIGRPKRDVRRGSSRVVRYEADYRTMAFVLDYEAELHFTHGRLTSVRLENGE